jgi:hypothetical protein
MRSHYLFIEDNYLSHMVGELTPCFAVEAFECQGARKSGMPTGSSTVPCVVEHGGRLSTS